MSAATAENKLETLAYSPPDEPPPLTAISLPRVSLEDVNALFLEGWTKVNLDGPDDELQQAFNALLEAGEQFFAQPRETKVQFKSTQHGSELGWSRVEGEKELITLRSLGKTPDVLKEPASHVWHLCGALLNNMMQQIEASLNLQPGALTAYSQPCIDLQENPTATMLRLFRYEVEDSFKVVGEPHSDLGLLSLVYSDTPGLEVWERFSQTFYPIEQEYVDPSASVLVGSQLAKLSNGRYPPGGHQVVGLPPSAMDPKTRRSPKYRYSIVFILRAHWPVPIDTDRLTTDITGQFHQPMRNMTAWDLYKQISSSHFNINIDPKERQRQKEALEKKKQAKSASG